MPASTRGARFDAAPDAVRSWPGVPRPLTAPVAQPATGRFAFFVFQLYAIILIGRPQDYVPSLVPLRLALVFTTLTLLVTVFQSAESRTGLFSRIETKLYLAIFAAMCIGIPLSINRRASYEYVILIHVVNVIFYLLFIRQVDTIAKFRRIVFVLVLSSLFFSAAGLANGEFLGGRFVTGSTMFDPNDIAFMNVCLLPFGLAAMLGTFRTTTKLLGLASVILGVLLALYTGSRGGFLGLATMFVLFLVVRTPKVRKVHKVVLLVILAAAMLTLAGNFNIDRYRTLTDVGSDYNLQEEEGRLQIWKRGLVIFSRSPVTGVGVNGFWQAIGMMRADENITPVWQAPHNSYIEILTETGLIGTVPFVVLIAACVKGFKALRRRSGSFTDKDLDVFPGIFLMGFVSLLVAAFFLSQAYSLQFTLYFALAAAFRGIADATREPGSSAA